MAHLGSLTPAQLHARRVSCAAATTSAPAEPAVADWRKRARPIPAGGTYPAKEHCSNCGLCDTYYVAKVKEACAFLGPGMSKIDEMEPMVHGRGRWSVLIVGTLSLVQHDSVTLQGPGEPRRPALWGAHARRHAVCQGSTTGGGCAVDRHRNAHRHSNAGSRQGTAPVNELSLCCELSADRAVCVQVDAVVCVQSQEGDRFGPKPVCLL